MSAAPPPAPPSPSLNAGSADDRSVSYGVDAAHPEDPATIRLRPAPDADPILVMSLDPVYVETVLAAARLYRPTLEWAHEVNRVDKLISTCERALAIYRDWIEERQRAFENGEAAAVLRRRESAARRGQGAPGQGDV